MIVAVAVAVAVAAVATAITTVFTVIAISILTIQHCQQTTGNNPAESDITNIF